MMALRLRIISFIVQLVTMASRMHLGLNLRTTLRPVCVQATGACVILGFLLPLSQSMVATAMEAPTDKDNILVRQAFKDFDTRKFDASEKEFTESIDRWKILDRPRDELVSLLKARASVYLDNKKFNKALEDYSDAIDRMKTDGETPDGRARYPEYPDTFAGRALAEEGLADWSAALADYDKAIELWGGGRSADINPYILTFRGNVLCRLGRYSDAILDYEVSSDIFNSMRDVARYSDARSNLALALYEVGKVDEAVKAMNDVIRKNPGYADMHVALAAHSWSQGRYIDAFKEWNFACDRIDVGCAAYKDISWVKTVRRWPPSLVKNLSVFLTRDIPDALKGAPGQALAPKSSL